MANSPDGNEDEITSPLLDMTAQGSDLATPCNLCADTVYTRARIDFGIGSWVVCPFCLALIIDRCTGWKVWGTMHAWENTRMVHAALRRGTITMDWGTEPNNDPTASPTLPAEQ